MQEFINIVLSNGIFATLFVALLFYQLKDSSQREKKYISTIEKLSKHLDTVEDIKEDISEIKSAFLKPKKGKKSEIKILKKDDISEIQNFKKNDLSDTKTFKSNIPETINLEGKIPETKIFKKEEMSEIQVCK